MYNIFQTFYTSQENGNVEIHCTRILSPEPSVFAQTQKLENPQHLEWLQMHVSPITDRTVRMFYNVLYIIIGSSREFENNVAHPIHVRSENLNYCHLQRALFIYFSFFCFKSGVCLLIAPGPVHCFSITIT